MCGGGGGGDLGLGGDSLGDAVGSIGAQGSASDPGFNGKDSAAADGGLADFDFRGISSIEQASAQPSDLNVEAFDSQGNIVGGTQPGKNTAALAANDVTTDTPAEINQARASAQTQSTSSVLGNIALGNVAEVVGSVPGLPAGLDVVGTFSSMVDSVLEGSPTDSTFGNLDNPERGEERNTGEEFSGELPDFDLQGILDAFAPSFIGDFLGGGSGPSDLEGGRGNDIGLNAGGLPSGVGDVGGTLTNTLLANQRAPSNSNVIGRKNILEPFQIDQLQAIQNPNRFAQI